MVRLLKLYSALKPRRRGTDLEAGDTVNVIDMNGADNVLDASGAVILPLLDINQSIVSETSVEFKNDTRQLFKDVEDGQFSDVDLIARLEALALESASARAKMKEAVNGNENLSLLHYAAKSFRLKLVDYLIEKIDIGIC